MSDTLLMPISTSRTPQRGISAASALRVMKASFLPIRCAMITGFVLALIVSLVPISAQADVAGVDWEIQTPAADNDWLSVTYGNGLFVAVASGAGDRVMTSGSLFPTTPVPLAPMWLLGIMAGFLSVLGVRKLRNA